MSNELSKYDTYVPDCLFPTDNQMEIPTLWLDVQPQLVEIPFLCFGEQKRTKDMGGHGTLHFYTDDYRWQSVYEHPEKILNHNPANIVEPNYSLFNETPMAFGLQSIYKKRWIARQMQERGIGVFVDLCKIIDNLYDYINNIKLNRGIRLLRVDNLRINADYAAHILGKSGSEVISGAIGKSGIGGGITPKLDKSGFKALQKQTKQNADGYSKEVRFDKSLFYTHRMIVNKDALNDLIGHAYTADELKAIEKLPQMLSNLSNARYDPLKISRPNIRKKISGGAKHFVEYDIEIDGIQFILKTKAVKDTHGKFLIEYPYFFREKK